MNLFLLLGATLTLQAAAPAFPDTPTGRAAQELVQAIQSGEEAPMARFVERHLQPNPMLWTNTANFRVLLAKAHDPKGLGVEDIKHPEENLVIWTLVSQGDGRRSRVVLARDPKSGRMHLQLRPLVPPEDSQRFHWPEGKASRQGTLDAIRRHLELLARHDKWSGVVLIAKGDKVLLQTAHGLAERSLGVPIRAETKFDIASAGKLFTAVTVGQLAEEGRLSLDDAVGKYLPDYPDPAVREKVTLRHLLNHTAGTGSLFFSPGYDRTRRYSRAAELLTALHAEPLAFEPGTQWDYSNGGFVMLGAIIERLEGVDYRESFRRRVWEPLGMRDTGIVGRDALVPNLSRLYDRSPLDPFGREPKVLDTLQYGWIGGPHGGGHSTARDLFLLARALRKQRLLKPETLSELVTPTPLSEPHQYALGFEVSTEQGLRVVGHYGHARASVGLLWELDVTVIALGNDLSEHAVGVARGIHRLIARNAQAF